MYFSTREVLVAQERLRDYRLAAERERLLRTVLAQLGTPKRADRLAQARRKVIYRLGGRFVAWGEGLQRGHTARNMRNAAEH